LRVSGLATVGIGWTVRLKHFASMVSDLQREIEMRNSKTMIRRVCFIGLAVCAAAYLYETGQRFPLRRRVRPYDARAEVYEAFLRDLRGDVLLIQNDTSALPDFPHHNSLAFLPKTTGLQYAADEASTAYETHQSSISTIAELGARKPVRMISHSIVLAILNPPNRIHPEEGGACAKFAPNNTLVVFSPVAFNATKDFAVLQSTVIFNVCLYGRMSGGWVGDRMFQRCDSKWLPVENKVFADTEFDR
jgi:hypothetical protein